MRNLSKMLMLVFALMVGGLVASDGFAQSKKPSSDGSSKSSPKSSPPSSPKSSPPSSPKSSPPSSPKSSPSDKPKFTAPNSDKKPTPPSSDKKPPSSSDKPKFTAPKGDKDNQKPPSSSDKPKFTAPNSDKKLTPPSSDKSNNSNSTKPKSDNTNVSAKAQANKEAHSEKKFQESAKASQPPKSKYTAPNGKEVSIRPESKNVQVIRNQSSTVVLQPQVRQQHTVDHIHHHHYHHDYNWYCNRPYVYVGGGYNSAFWWMMMEWSAERRALWLYNNRYNIEHDAYMRGLQDAEVNRRIAELEAQRHQRNQDYVDPEFAQNPHLMYDQDFLEAVYNPTHVDNSAVLHVFLVLGCIVLGGVVVWGLYHLFFKVRWGQ